MNTYRWISCLLLTLSGITDLPASGRYFDESDLVQVAEAIAVIDLAEPEACEVKAHVWTYHKRANVTVLKSISGELPATFDLYGNANAFGRTCKLAAGRYLAFFRHDGELWTGSGGPLALRPIRDGKVEWYRAQEERLGMAMQPVDEVLRKITRLRAKLARRLRGPGKRHWAR